MVQALVPFLTCLIFNLLQKHTLIISFANSLILASSILFFVNAIDRSISKIILKEKRYWLAFGCLGLMPIYSQVLDVSFYIKLIILFFLLTFFVRFKSKFSQLFLIIIFIFAAFLSLSKLNVLSFTTSPIRINFSDNAALTSRKVVSENELVLQEMRKNLMIYGVVTKYRITTIIYNDLFLYYPVLVNAMGFLSASSFYNSFLIANLYPFIFGLVSFSSELKNKHAITFGFTAFLATIGIYIYNSNTKVFFFFLPIFVSLILLGLTKVKLKVYYPLLIFSILISIFTK